MISEIKTNSVNSFIPRIFPSYSTVAKLVISVLSMLPQVQRSSFIPYSYQKSLDNLEFPSYLAQICEPEVLVNSHGNAGCKITEMALITLEECNQESFLLATVLKDQMPDLYKDVVYLRRDPQKGESLNEDSKGFGVKREDGVTVSFGILPAKLNQCKKAHAYVQKNILEKGGFFQKTPDEIVEVIQKTHALMMKHIASSNFGHFREDNALVTGENVSKSLEGYTEEFLRLGGASSDVDKFQKALIKASKEKDLTEEDVKLIRKLSPAAVFYQEIASEMRVFSQNLKSRMEQVLDEASDEFVVETAAWVHQEIGRIHPFSNGNGRIARLWMNAVLHLGGISGVVFPNETKYVEATDADLRGTSGAFASYLKEVIFWNENNLRTIL